MFRRSHLMKAAACLSIAISISGCTNPYDPGQRALGGGAIGAGTGAAIGALAGGGRGAAAGALIGGAVGAVTGAVTTPQPPMYAPEAAPAGWYPEMVWLPSPGVYVASDYAYPLFFYDGFYYAFYGGSWYSGPSYRGPWQVRPAPPPALHGFRSAAWSSYQARARSYYRSDPNWRHFRPR
jgi:hypothetical protein